MATRNRYCTRVGGKPKPGSGRTKAGLLGRNPGCRSIVRRSRDVVFSCLISGLLVAGVAPVAHADRKSESDYLRVYRGSFASALTPDPDDDLNFNRCDERVSDCAEHADPLKDILLKIERDRRGQVRADFYRSSSDLEAGRALDLLGRGCGTRIGKIEDVKRHKAREEQGELTARFDLDVENRLCHGKLRPTSTHFMLVTLDRDPESGEPTAQVRIDKGVVSKNYLYIKEDGERRRVRMDLDNTQGKGRRARYRICKENALGEFNECVVTDKQLKNFGFPLPVPGGAAVSYTWWYDLYPNLKRTRGLYELEQYVGRFHSTD